MDNQSIQIVVSVSWSDLSEPACMIPHLDWIALAIVCFPLSLKPCSPTTNAKPDILHQVALIQHIAVPMDSTIPPVARAWARPQLTMMKLQPISIPFIVKERSCSLFLVSILLPQHSWVVDQPGECLVFPFPCRRAARKCQNAPVNNYKVALPCASLIDGTGRLLEPSRVHQGVGHWEMFFGAAATGMPIPLEMSRGNRVCGVQPNVVLRNSDP